MSGLQWKTLLDKQRDNETTLPDVVVLAPTVITAFKWQWYGHRHFGIVCSHGSQATVVMALERSQNHLGICVLSGTSDLALCM